MLFELIYLSRPILTFRTLCPQSPSEYVEWNPLIDPQKYAVICFFYICHARFLSLLYFGRSILWPCPGVYLIRRSFGKIGRNILFNSWTIFIRIPILVAFDSRRYYISAVLLSSLP